MHNSVIFLQTPRWSLHTLLLDQSHYLGFPQLFRRESSIGLSAPMSATDTLPMCSNNQHASLGWSVRKVSLICWSSCSVLAHLEGQLTFKSWV